MCTYNSNCGKYIKIPSKCLDVCKKIELLIKMLNICQNASKYQIILKVNNFKARQVKKTLYRFSFQE